MRYVWRSALLVLVVTGLAPAWASTATAPAHGPSLAEQLRGAHARQGSAFATLIAANQDFALLRPEELTQTGVPPWLRVLWRRAHPEGHYSSADPTGGYPLVLAEVYEWMQTHQDLLPGVGEEPTTDPGAPAKATVSGEQRISGAQTSRRSESDVRINFNDPQKIIAASNDISGSGAQAQYFSTDGGASWGQTTLPLLVDAPFFDAFQSDPTVDWTSDGTAWATTIGVNASGSQLHMRAYKSVDNGATWSFDATFSGAQSSADKEILWVDHSAASPYKDNLYVIWHNGPPAFIARRTGPTGSWQTPIQVSGAETNGTAIGGDVKTNAAGDVFGFWPATGGRRVFVVKSTNGGASFGPPLQIGTTFGGYDIGVPAFTHRRALIYVSAAAFRTSEKNLVYATWTDLSGAPGCTAAANEPGSNAASTCKTRVWFARSTDGGATWAPAVKVNDQSGANDQFNQWLALDETTGALSLMYYDTVADAGRKKVDVWYQSSHDDGQSWSAALKVTSAQTDETVAGADLGNQFGDYNGLSAYASLAFPSWTDRRNAAKEEIWTAKIQECTPTGAPVIGGASASAPNQVQVTWGNGAPASSSFDVERALGTCAAPGAFAVVGAQLAGSPFTDGEVSAGSTYAYRVKGRDATTICTSPSSGCVEVVPTGACTLSPSFGGLATVTTGATASCGVALTWPAASAPCAGAIGYDVYRSTTSGFAPAPANRIASNVSGTAYLDTNPVPSGTAFYYVVRARDLGNGMADANAVERSVTVSGPPTSILADTFEGASGFDTPGWTHGAPSGANDWVRTTAQSQTATHSWSSTSLPSVGDRVLATPVFTPTASATLSFWHTYSLEISGAGNSCFDGATLEISVDGGSTWNVLPDAAFLTGGFVATVNGGYSNPLAGKRAWCGGGIGAMSEVRASLAAYAGMPMQLRWHEGDDETGAETGWFVDSVQVTSTSACTPGLVFADGFELAVPLPSPWSAAHP